MAEEKDFLEEMIDIWTEKDPSFRATFEAAWQRHEMVKKSLWKRLALKFLKRR